MHATPSLAHAASRSEAILPEILQVDQSVTAACTQAGDFVRDFFSRGPMAEENKSPSDDASLHELYYRMEASIQTVAQLRSSSYAEVRQKRTLSEALRPHRALLSDWLAAIGESVDEDMRLLHLKPTRVVSTGQGGWLGWALTPWKQRSDDAPVERVPMRA